MPAPIRRFVIQALGTVSLLAASISLIPSRASADNSNNRPTAPVKIAVITPNSAGPVVSSPGSSSASTSATPASGATSSTPQGVLPGGATALAETFSDWQVICALPGGTKRCVAKQEQISQQNKQLVLAVELTPADDKVEGVALMPFGLTLDNGVTLQIDESTATAPLRFRTCVPGGCVLPLSFDAHTLDQLRAGSVLKAKVTIDGGQDATLSISLKGFAAALDRTATLMADKTASIKR